MKLFVIILFPCLCFSQSKNPNEWKFLKSDTISGLIISIKNNKTFTEYKAEAKQVNNVFQRGMVGTWSDYEDGEQTFYSGIQTDSQIKSILLKDPFSGKFTKEFDLTRWYRFIPLTKLME